jgi:hypothetical protein
MQAMELALEPAKTLMEVATLAWFFSALASPFAVPFLVLTAAPSRWVFAASVLGLAVGGIMLLGYWANTSDAPGAVGLLYLAPAMFAGWLVGGAVWLVRAWRGRSENPSWKQAAILYVIAASFFAAATYPWR